MPRPMGRVSASLIDPSRPGSLAARMRQRRWRMFEEHFPDISKMSVLDLGGTAAAWRLLPGRPVRLVFLNIQTPGDLDGAESIIGDACDPPDELRRQRF